MRVSLVSVTIVSALAVVACSDATNPVAATRRTFSAQTLGDTTAPVAQGVRVDTLPLGPQFQTAGLNNFTE